MIKRNVIKSKRDEQTILKELEYFKIHLKLSSIYDSIRNLFSELSYLSNSCSGINICFLLLNKHKMECTFRLLQNK